MATRRLDTPKSERAELARQAESWATFILANLLWCIASIPVVTLPAATAGLFAVMMARARGETIHTIEVFLSTMRRLWLKATLVMALNVAGGELVVLNTAIFPHMDMSADPLAFAARSVTLFAGLTLLMLNVYLWPLLVLLDEMPLRQLVETAARLVFAHPLWSLLIVVAVAFIVGFSLLLPRGVFAIATASASSLIVYLGAWRVIQRHLPDEPGQPD